MTIECINQLFENGLITSEEHQELINQTIGNPKPTSKYNKLTFFFALCGYLLMLTFTKNGHTFSLLSNGNQRLWAGAIFSALGLFTFYKYRKEIDSQRNHNYLAYIGIGLIVSLLVIVIPVFLMLLD